VLKKKQTKFAVIGDKGLHPTIKTVQMKEVIQSMKVASDALRLRLFLLLFDEEACVCELMEVFGLKQSDISYHLIQLHKVGFVERIRRGKYSYYRINTKLPNTLYPSLLRFLVGWLEHDKTIIRDKTALQKSKLKCGVSCR
jgi:DNA-binding transcriptional ArsR family regulator